MIHRAALAFLVLTAPAAAQTARVVPDCAGRVLGSEVGASLTVDQNGKLCTTGILAPAAGAAPGGISTFSRIPSSAASSNLTNAKSSAGRAYTYQGCNTTASLIYLRVYNAASTAAVTVGTTAPFAGPYAFPPNTCIQATSFADSIGVYASSGITYAFGTTPSDTDASAIGSGAISAFQIGYQ